MPRPASGDLLVSLVDRLHEKPSVDDFGFYRFHMSGVLLHFDDDHGFFDQLILELRTGRTEETKPFGGMLPFGISRDDTEETVEKKLPGCTMEIKDYRFDLDLRPLVVFICISASRL